MIDNNLCIAIASIFGFICAIVGYVIGKAEGESIAAGEPTETGVNGL